MSYRGIKRVLGETSLERKCRFLFGGGLMLFITGSFYFYARLNSTLVYKQNQTTAQLLISPILMETHWKELESKEEFDDKQEDVQPLIEELATSFNPDEVRANRWQFLAADPANRRRTSTAPKSRHRPRCPRENPPGEAREVIDINHAEGEYNYYGEIRRPRRFLPVLPPANHAQPRRGRADGRGQSHLALGPHRRLGPQPRDPPGHRDHHRRSSR